MEDLITQYNSIPSKLVWPYLCRQDPALLCVNRGPFYLAVQLPTQTQVSCVIRGNCLITAESDLEIRMSAVVCYFILYSRFYLVQPLHFVNSLNKKNTQDSMRSKARLHTAIMMWRFRVLLFFYIKIVFSSCQ